jgi:hypothetical protein
MAGSGIAMRTKAAIMRVKHRLSNFLTLPLVVVLFTKTPAGDKCFRLRAGLWRKNSGFRIQDSEWDAGCVVAAPEGERTRGVA